MPDTPDAVADPEATAADEFVGLSPEERAERDRRALYVMLRQLRELAAQQEYDASMFAAIEAEYRAGAEAGQREIERLSNEVAALAAEHKRPGTEYAEVPGMARVQFTTHQPTVAVADKAAALAWAQAHEHPEFVNKKPPPPPELKTAEFKKFAEGVLNAEGEVLPGIERVPGSTTHKITFREGGR